MLSSYTLCGLVLVSSAEAVCHAVSGVELVRKVSCAGANTAKNPPRVTDVALRPPRRQSSLDREAVRDAEAQQRSGRSALSLTLSGNNWELF